MATELLETVFSTMLKVYEAAKKAKENESEFEELTELVKSVGAFLERNENTLLELSERYEVSTTLRRLDMTLKQVTHHIEKVTTKNNTLWNWYRAEEYGHRQEQYKENLDRYLNNLSIFVNDVQSPSAAQGGGHQQDLSKGAAGPTMGSTQPADSATKDLIRARLSPQAMSAVTELSIAVEETLASQANHIAEALQTVPADVQQKYKETMGRATAVHQEMLIKFEDPRGAVNESEYITGVAQYMTLSRQALGMLDNSSPSPTPHSPSSPSSEGNGEGGHHHTHHDGSPCHLRDTMEDHFTSIFGHKWGMALDMSTEKLLEAQPEAVSKDAVQQMLLEKVCDIMENGDAVESQLQLLVKLQQSVEEAIITQIAKTMETALSNMSDGLRQDMKAIVESSNDTRQQMKTDSEALGREIAEQSKETLGKLEAMKGDIHQILEEHSQQNATAATRVRHLTTAVTSMETEMKRNFDETKFAIEESLDQLRQDIAADTDKIVTTAVSAAEANITTEVKEAVEDQTKTIVAGQHETQQEVKEGFDQLREELSNLRKQLAEGVELTPAEALALIPDIKQELVKYYQTVYESISVMQASADVAFEETFQMSHASDANRSCQTIQQWLDKADQCPKDTNCQPWTALVVEGQAGMGKSSMCKHVARSQLVPNGRIALLVDLPRLKAEVESRRLGAGENIDREMCINVALSSWKRKKNAGLVEFEIEHVRKVINSQNILWLLDGFDEVSAVTNRTTSAAMQEFIDSCFEKSSGFRHSRDIVLVTTRQERQDSIALNLNKGVPVLQLQLKKWSRYDIRRYINKFFAAYYAALLKEHSGTINNEEKLEWVNEAKSAVLRATCLPALRLWDGVPLLYDILCCWAQHVFSEGKDELPRVSPDSILEFAVSKCYERETLKTYDRPVVSYSEARKAAEKLAYQVLSAACVEIDPGRDDTQYSLSKSGWFIRVGQETNFDDEEAETIGRKRAFSKTLYKFAHRSFAEYFVARRLFRLLEDPKAAKKEVLKPTTSTVTLSLLAHLLKTEQLRIEEEGAYYTSDDLLEEDHCLVGVSTSATNLIRSRITTLLSILQGNFEEKYRDKRWEIARELGGDPVKNTFAVREKWRNAINANNMVEVSDVLEDFKFCYIKGRRLVWYHALLLEPVCRVGRYDAAVALMQHMLIDQLTHDVKSSALLQVTELLERTVEADDNSRQSENTSLLKTAPSVSLGGDWVDVGEFASMSDPELLKKHLETLGATLTLVQACNSGCYRVIERLIRVQQYGEPELLTALLASISVDEPDCVESLVQVMTKYHGTIFVGGGASMSNSAAVRFRRCLQSTTSVSICSKEGLEMLQKFPSKIQMNWEALTLTAVGRHIGDASLRRIVTAAPLLTTIRLESLCFGVSSSKSLHILAPLKEMQHFSLRDCRIPLEDDDVVFLLKSFPHLISLDLGECYGFRSNAVLETLSSGICPEFEDLDLTGSGCLLSDSGLAAIPDGCPKMKRLMLHRSQGFRDMGIVAFLKKCTGLTELSLGYLRHVTNETLQAVAESCTQLKRLCVAGLTQHTSDEQLIRVIAANPGLTQVDLSDNIGNFTDASLKAIAEHCACLRSLSVAKNPEGFTDEGMEAIAGKCILLSELDVSFTYGNITDESITMIAQSGRLVNLNVSRTAGGITDESVRALAEKCGDVLKSLDVSQTAGSVTDEALGHLALRCHHLRSLKMSWNGTALSSNSIHDVLEANPMLRVLETDGCFQKQSLFSNVFYGYGIEGRWLQVIRASGEQALRDRHVCTIATRCHSLQELSIARTSGNITHQSINCMSYYCYRWLEVLDISDTDGAIADGCMQNLLQCCHQIRSLNISSTKGAIGDILMSSLADHQPWLETLMACNMSDALSDVGVRRLLRGCRALKTLHLDRNSRVTDVSAENIAQKCPALIDLSLASTGITDRGIAQIASKNTRLETLSISGTKCTSAAVVSLCHCLNLSTVALEELADDDSRSLVEAVERLATTCPLRSISLDKSVERLGAEIGGESLQQLQRWMEILRKASHHRVGVCPMKGKPTNRKDKEKRAPLGNFFLGLGEKLGACA